MLTKKAYQEHLNEIGENLTLDKYIIGGKMRSGRYGNMLRKHDPIAFEVGYREWVNSS
jgi:hypothetical protein